MLDELIKLIERNYALLNFSMSYSKITDWQVIVEHRLSVDNSEVISAENHSDLMLCVAEAYIKTANWLSEHKGGY